MQWAAVRSHLSLTTVAPSECGNGSRHNVYLHGKRNGVDSVMKWAINGLTAKMTAASCEAGNVWNGRPFSV